MRRVPGLCAALLALLLAIEAPVPAAGIPKGITNHAYSAPYEDVRLKGQ